jgi:AcrR family transcriptional regulator
VLSARPAGHQALFDAAAAEFADRGFDATSIRDIAESVGISSSTLYHHFTNKQDILHAAVTRFMTDFVEACVPTLQDRSLTPTERIRRAVRLHIEFSDDRRPELLVGNPIRNALDPEHRDLGLKLQRAYHDAVRDTIDEGRRAGEFTVGDVSVTTMAVLDMLNGIREWFSPAGPLTRSEIIDRYVDLVMTILGAAPDDPR